MSTCPSCACPSEAVDILDGDSIPLDSLPPECVEEMARGHLGEALGCLERLAAFARAVQKPADRKKMAGAALPSVEALGRGELPASCESFMTSVNRILEAARTVASN